MNAIEDLLAMRATEECYDVPYAALRDRQLAAINERLQQQRERIKLVKFRASEADLTEVRRLDDVVPLLLPHTAYKSYPENFLIEERWDKLTKWLGTVSSLPLSDVDLAGVTDVDCWIDRLDAAGHPVSCSSGTTGKSAMLIASPSDLEHAAEDTVTACAWATGIAPAQDRRVFSLAPVATVPRNTAILQRLREAFGKPDAELFRYPVPPITVGSITRMVALRKRIADGAITPGELAEFEATSAEREAALRDAVGITADALIAARHEKLLLTGMWGNLYKVAAAVRERGFVAADFHHENMMYVGGGLKREELPADYQEFVRGTFNVKPRRNFQLYGMQEIGSVLPRCSGGRYHLPPWLVCLPLDKDGETRIVADESSGEIEGRAAFFDLSLEGRWGGIISGDRIQIDFGACGCGARSPSIRDSVVRYADLEGDDKIGCAGTIDAYVRGTS